MHYLEVVFFNIIKMKVNTNEIQRGVENTFFSPRGTKYQVFPADVKVHLSSVGSIKLV